MTFSFLIEDAFEIHKDPGGHHHHWTILVGTLEEGTLRRNDRIKIPYIDGSSLVSIVGGIEQAHLMDNLLEISADEADLPLGIMTWVPAADENRVERNTLSYSCSEADYKSNLVWSLENDPIRFIHRQGDYVSACDDCIAAVDRIPEFEEHMKQLISHSNLYVAQYASCFLDGRSRQSSKNKRFPWWAFWKK